MNLVVEPSSVHVIGVYSWTTGFIPTRVPTTVRTEEEALRHALCIEHRTSSEAGIEFLDDWLARNLP